MERRSLGPPLELFGFLFGFTISHNAPQLAVGSSTFLGGGLGAVMLVRVSFRGGRSGRGRGGTGGGTVGELVPLVLMMAVGWLRRCVRDVFWMAKQLVQRL